MSRLYTDHAALYDAAFDWDVHGQANAISALSGITQGRVLEPMCGSGRLLRAFAAEGFDTVGVDNSREMLALAAARYARDGLTGAWTLADVTNFDLDEACQLAVCPINSLAHLPSSAAMEAHLHAVSRNLYAGSSYWIQLDLGRPAGVDTMQSWDFLYEGRTLQMEWGHLGFQDSFELQRSRCTFPDGRVVEETHRMKFWLFDDWMTMLSRTRFDLSAAYTGYGEEFAPLTVSESLNGQHLCWHQLVKAG
jgi:SAM-dependent methyltransferase